MGQPIPGGLEGVASLGAWKRGAPGRVLRLQGSVSKISLVTFIPGHPVTLTVPP